MKKFLQQLFIFILGLSFLLTVLIAAFTWQKPQSVIALLEALQQQVSPTPAPLKLTGIGVLGDSQSDEYQGNDGRGGTYATTTMNWVELLAEKRQLPFGEWGQWEEPRRQGYAYNWSRSGATSYSLLVSGQHTGLAQQVKEGKVNVVIIWIGVNDFAPYITADGYEAIYAGSLSDALLTQKVNRIVSEIKTAVEVIKQEKDVPVIIVKIPDWANHIGVQIAFPLPEQRERVSNAVEKANTQLEAYAKNQNITTVDPNEFLKSVSRNNNGVQVTVGDIQLQRLLLTNDPRNMFLDDGVHTGTIMNGLFANYMIDHLNTALGTQILPFSTKEILENAGL